MSLSEVEAKSLSHIFSQLSIDWLSNGDYSEETFCKGKFKLHNDFDLSDLEYHIVNFCNNFSRQHTKEGTKLKSFLEFTSSQLKIWKSFNEETKLYWMNMGGKFTSFPMVLYQCPWTEMTPKINLPKPKNEAKAQAKQLVNDFFNSLKFLDSDIKSLLLNTQISPQLIDKKYSHMNFTKSLEHALKLKDILNNSLPAETLKLAGLEKKTPQYLANISLLKKQLSLFLQIVTNFQKQGKSITSSQLSLSQEYFENYSLMFYNQEITSDDKLQEILYEYINHNGIYYLDLLLQVNLYSENPQNQSFFLHSPFKLKAKDSDTVYLKKMGQAESIKTARQGRIGNLEENLKNPLPVGNKKNQELSKYELIGRINQNRKNILTTYETLKKMKVAFSDLSEMNTLVNSLPTYTESELESLDHKELVKISQRIFGAVASVRRIQSKYHR